MCSVAGWPEEVASKASGGDIPTRSAAVQPVQSHAHAGVMTQEHTSDARHTGTHFRSGAMHVLAHAYTHQA